MFQKPCKTLGYMEIMASEIPPGGSMTYKLLSFNFPFINVVTVRQIYRNNCTHCTVCSKSCFARSVGKPPRNIT